MKNLTPLQRAERDCIIEYLVKNHYNKRDAAKELGVARETLYRKARKYLIGLRDPNKAGFQPNKVDLAASMGLIETVKPASPDTRMFRAPSPSMASNKQ